MDGYSFFISGNTTSTAGTSTPLKLYDRSDEITSRFYYDALGRLVVSQNAKQFYSGAALSKNVYSYTLYDAIGRITEVGEITSTSPIETAYNGSKMDQSLFNSWINQSGSSRKQVTKSFYDQAVFTSTPIGTAPYLRHRVSSTTYTENFTGNINAYNSATHYAYDVHGNVNKIVNDLPELEVYEARYKVTEYEYDVLSGKVNQVIFQKNKNDQFAHHYEYDNLNRLTGVYTSQKSSVFYGEQYHSLWQKDAKYSYYLHGPLARTEIGNDRVQGLDYAYNLQGWLKGLNSGTLLAERDMGKDGCNTCGTNLNSNFAKDEMGFVLGYFEGDYTPVTTFASNAYFDISTKDPSQTNSELLNEKKDLFNGNISYMTTAIGKFMEGLTTKPNSMVYGYDQLNRLISTKRFNNINMIDNYWESGGQANTDYNESFSYDPNGNILTLQRNGIDANGTNEMDNLHYFYEGIGENQKKNTNKLLSVSDDVTNYNLTGSSDFASGQSFTPGSLNGNNYNYDEIGNLVKDLQEEIEEISWNVYGKISKIRRISGSTKPDLEFAYDASGNRIKKIVKPAGSEIWDITYYLRDAQGNVLTTYTLKENALKQDRLYIYGSSRLGELVADAKNQDLCSISISEDELLNSREQAIDGLIRNLFSNLQDPQFTEQIVSYWNVKWNDYFSQTGLMHPNTNNIQTHQFNWNAWVAWMCKMKCYENLNSEVLGIWENHWNGRLQAFYNGTITCGYVECPQTYNELLTEWTVNLNNEVLPQMQAHNFVSSCSVQNNVYIKGSRRYELSNHLGNVLVVVSDRKIESDEDYFYAGLGSGYKFENGTYLADVDGEYRQNSGPDGVISSYSAEVISANDYYAFGSLMPGRSFSGGEYKCGFNGQERDDEVAGVGNINTAEFWEYDTRLGRRWNLDPVVKPWMSSYHAFSNKPIWNIDPNGANDGIYLIDEKTQKEIKVNNQGDNEGYDIYYTGKVNKDGSMSARNTSRIVYVENGIKTTLEKNGIKFDPEYRTYNFSEETNRFVVDLMLDASIGYMTGGGFLKGIIRNRYWNNVICKMGKDFTSQLLANGNHNSVNVSSILLSGFLPETFTSHAVKHSISVGASLTIDGQVSVYGITHNDFSYVLKSATVGFLFDRGGVLFERMSIANTQYLSRLRSLSYKPIKAVELNKYETRLKVGSFLSIERNSIILGAIGNSIQNLWTPKKAEENK